MARRSHQDREIKLWERIVLELLWGLFWVIGHLPHFVLYRMLAPTIRFVLYRMIGYRKGVVVDNLRRSFPEKSDEEREKIAGDFYTILSEIIVSTVAMTNSRTFESVFSTIEVEQGDPDQALRLRELTRGKSWVALTAHFGLWEYLLTWSGFADQRIIAIYHTLGNKISDELFKRLRSKHHKVTPVSAKESMRFIVKNGTEYQGESFSFGLIADQNPPLLPNSHWFSFLGQDTIFFEGGEKIAMRTKLPVYYAYQRRRGAGRYDFCFKTIWDGVEPVEEGEITTRYVAMLEEQIRKAPHMWLWSHKRWKISRESLESAKWREARG